MNIITTAIMNIITIAINNIITIAVINIITIAINNTNTIATNNINTLATADTKTISIKCFPTTIVSTEYLATGMYELISQILFPEICFFERWMFLRFNS
ncbi:hypothetical protein ElyMa_001591200 [Elysia marginata]|uniref:Uncharacterized protein n=1 Tax=Elysia marginata TaxID=1093978 RepID=A0AAV4JEU9_9GAST|nr:hypothetical protein ElyMa_001591200 [Elysia marginata]